MRHSSSRRVGESDHQEERRQNQSPDRCRRRQRTNNARRRQNPLREKRVPHTRHTRQLWRSNRKLLRMGPKPNKRTLDAGGSEQKTRNQDDQSLQRRAKTVKEGRERYENRRANARRRKSSTRTEDTWTLAISYPTFISLNQPV